MRGAPHQQVTTPWSAPFPAPAAAPPGLAQQLPSPPNSANGRGSPPTGSITRRPRIDKRTGQQAGEDIFVCWLIPAQPNPFGRKFQKEWRLVDDPNRAQETSQQAILQAQMYQDDIGLNHPSAAVGTSRTLQQPGRVPPPGPKPNVEVSGLSKKDKKKIIEDWQRQVEEYTKQEKRDAEATEKSDRKNNMKHSRSQSQNPMPGYQEAYLQQQFLQQHQPPVAGPSNQSRRPSFSASPWQAQQQQPFTPSQPQSGIVWPSPNQSTQLNRANTFNGGRTNTVRMPGTMAGTDEFSDIETRVRMATQKGDKSLDGYISAAEERGRERQRRISGSMLGLTSRSRSRAPEGGAMGHGVMDPNRIQNVWENAQQRQRKISTAERPAYFPQAGGVNMGQYQQGVIPQQPSPNMQPGHVRRVPVKESAKPWEQNTRIIPGGRPQHDDDDDDDDDYDDNGDNNDWGEWHKQSSAPSQMPQARTPYMQHQKTPLRHPVAIQQQQPQQVQFATQPSPNTATQQMWPSQSPMIPVQSQLAGGVIPSPMAGAGAFLPQPSPNRSQYIQMPANGISGHPSPMIQSNVMQGGVYPPGHILAGKPVAASAPSTSFTKTPAHAAQPLKTPAVNAQSFPAQGTILGDQLAAKLNQVQLSQAQPVPVAGGFVIPENVRTAIARGQLPPGIPQPQQQQQSYGLPQPPQLVPVPTGGGAGTLTSTGGIIPGGYSAPQPQPHEAQHQRVKYHQGQPPPGRMDPYQSYDGSSSGASPNPSAGRGGAESDLELLQPPKGYQQHQHQHPRHEQRLQQLQRQQQHQQQVRQTQHGPRFTPQGRFDPFIAIFDLNAPGEFPRLPRTLGEMRVTHQEWTAFIQEVLGTWQDRNPQPGKYGPAARQVSEIVDKWNVGCFKPLGVDVALFRGRKRKSGDARTQYDTRNDLLHFQERAAPLDDDGDSSDDNEDDDDEGVASALGSQVSHNSMLAGGRQLSAHHMLQLEHMRRERKRVLEEKRLAKHNSQQYEPAHSIAIFPVITD